MDLVAQRSSRMQTKRARVTPNIERLEVNRGIVWRHTILAVPEGAGTLT